MVALYPSHQQVTKALIVQARQSSMALRVRAQQATATMKARGANRMDRGVALRAQREQEEGSGRGCELAGSLPNPKAASC